jgi:hypothetical protein
LATAARAERLRHAPRPKPERDRHAPPLNRRNATDTPGGPACSRRAVVLLVGSLCLVHGGRQERQTLFMALIGSAVTPGKLGYHRAKGMGVAPRRVTPVEPDASIGARPVRRRLIEVIPSRGPNFPRMEDGPRRSNLDLLSDRVTFQIECGRQGNTPKDVSSGPLWFKAGGHERVRANPVEGVRATAARTVTPVQPRWRGEFPAWQQAGPAYNRSRRPGEAPGGEKLNHERGESPCQ